MIAIITKGKSYTENLESYTFNEPLIEIDIGLVRFKPISQPFCITYNTVNGSVKIEHNFIYRNLYFRNPDLHILFRDIANLWNTNQEFCDAYLDELVVIVDKIGDLYIAIENHMDNVLNQHFGGNN